MNLKKQIAGSIGVFIVLYLLDFILHGILLKDIYLETASVWRTKEEMSKLAWCFALGYLLFSPVFVFIFNVGYEEKKAPIQQGITYGIILGFLYSAMPNIISYAILPIPPELPFLWFIGNMLEFIAAGGVLGFIYKVMK